MTAVDVDDIDGFDLLSLPDTTDPVPAPPGTTTPILAAPTDGGTAPDLAQAVPERLRTDDPGTSHPRTPYDHATGVVGESSAVEGAVEGGATADTEPERGSSPEEPVIRERAESPPVAISVAGDRNTVAGRDVDQSTHIHNHYGAEDRAEARARVKKRSERGVQDPEALGRLASRFVPPPGLLGEAPAEEPPTALQILARRHVLLLAAPHHHCGQFAAASRLGHELGKAQSFRLVVREELADPDLRLSPDELLVEGEPAVLILDLRDAGEQELTGVQRGLVEFGEALRRHRSYLVLLLPPGPEREWEERFPGRVHLLDKPPSIDVLERYLAPTPLPDLETGTPLRAELSALWPPAVKRVADLVRRGVELDEEPLAALRDALRRETVGQADHFRAAIRTKQREQDAEWLALLLSAAVVEGAPPHHITDAADALRRHGGIDTVEPLPPLLRPSPFVRLTRLADENWFDLNSRELLPSGTGAELLRHVWREHTDLHDPLLKWLTALPHTIRGWEQEELERLADRAAELAGEGGARVALTLAIGWAESEAGRGSGQRGRRSPSHSIAVRLLTTAATDSVLGRRVRAQLWRWSQRGDPAVQLLTADVCAGIGTAFPRNALTRLKHLARSEDDRVREAVSEAAGQIGGELGFSRFLRYLTEWFTDADINRLAMLAAVVDRVLATVPERVDGDAAESFWRAALGSAPPNELRRLTRSWLRWVATLSPDSRGEALEPLVRATDGDPMAIARMHYASRVEPFAVETSPAEETSAQAVVFQLRTRLDEIDPAWDWGRER